MALSGRGRRSLRYSVGERVSINLARYYFIKFSAVSCWVSGGTRQRVPCGACAVNDVFHGLLPVLVKTHPDTLYFVWVFAPNFAVIVFKLALSFLYCGPEGCRISMCVCTCLCSRLYLRVFGVRVRIGSSMTWAVPFPLSSPLRLSPSPSLKH